MGCGICEQILVALVSGFVFLTNFLLTMLFQLFQAIFTRRNNT